MASRCVLPCLQSLTAAEGGGEQVFEGLKAFRHADGQVRVFRPQENALRMANSAVAVSMPPIPEDMCVCVALPASVSER